MIDVKTGGYPEYVIMLVAFIDSMELENKRIREICKVEDAMDEAIRLGEIE